MTATDFDNYYWADCIEDNYYTDVPNEDAPYVTPWAYNYNSEGGYENNWYDMKIFNWPSLVPGMVNWAEAELEIVN